MNDKKRVLFISHFSGLNGAPRSMINLICELRNYGVESFVVIPDKGDIEEELDKKNIKYFIGNYKCCFYEMSEKKLLVKKLGTEIVNLKAVHYIAKIIKDYQIDIVHSNSFSVDVGAMASYLAKCPHIWHLREFMEEDFGYTHNFKRKVSWLANKSSQLIAVSNAVNSKYTKKYKLKNISTVYNGLPFEQYRIDKCNLLDNENIEILISGHICKAKGQEDAICAIESLVKKGHTNVVLNIVGEGNRKYVNLLKIGLKKRGISNHVKFWGFQKDMQLLRSNMDIELVCSVSEAFGRVTIEAMLSDLLVIGANTAGTKELVKDNWNGLLYQQGNYQDLSDKIETVIQNKADYIQCIKNAKRIAIEKFGIENTALKVEKIYNKILRNQ